MTSYSNNNGHSDLSMELYQLIYLDQDLKDNLQIVNNIGFPVGIFDLKSHDLIIGNNSFQNLIEHHPHRKKVTNLHEYIKPYSIKQVLNLGRKNCYICQSDNQDSSTTEELPKKTVDETFKVYSLSLHVVTWEKTKTLIAIFTPVSLPSVMNFHSELSQLSSLVGHLPAMIYQCCNDQEWTMTYMSEHCWQLTGYEAEDLICNKHLSYASLVYEDDREFVRKEIEAAVASHTSFDLEYRIIHQSGKINWIWERGKGVYSLTGELLYLEGLMIDITAKRSLEQESSLLVSLSKSISSAINFETAVIYTLQKICTLGGWDFGEAWIPQVDRNCCSYLTAWFPNEKNEDPNCELTLAQFKKESYNYHFHYNEGLPGKSWSVEEALWFSNLPEQKLFIRYELAGLCGLKTACGIPVFARDEVVAVLVFFSRKSLSKNSELINLLQTVAYQLGHLFRNKKIETQLNQSRQELANIVDSSLGVFFRINYQQDENIDYVSKGCKYITGYSSDELIDNGKLNLSKIIHPLDLQKVSKIIQSSLEQLTSYNLEYRIFTKDNEEKWLWEKGQGIFDQKGNLLALEGVFADISNRKSLESSLYESEKRYRSFFENAIEGIFQMTIDGYYLSANKALANIYGYEDASTLIKELNHLDNCFYVQNNTRKKLMNLLDAEDVVTNFESQVYRHDGKVIWISENARAVRNMDGEFLYYEGTIEDITKYKKTQAKLHRQAFYDQLTNLPNRHLFTQHLHNSLRKIQTNSTDSYEFSVLFLDCDRFKAVNDSLGHSVGDSLLIAIGERLKNCVAQTDIVARLGGDEFTILCDDVQDIKNIITLAKKIKNAFQTPFLINEHQLFCGVSMGIFFSSSLEKEEYQTLTEAKILEYADTALYKAKSQKKGYYQIFQGDMHNQALANLQLENEIRRSLEKNQFVLHYQPIINLTTYQVKGFESLIRWNHPHKGLIRPGYFMNLAEETGLIIPISYWVLKEGCRQLQKWHEQIMSKNVSIDELPTLNINLSCQEFAMDDFLNNLDQIISETGVDCRYLRLEITENSSIFQNEVTEKVLQRLVARNIQLWVDDFGTGYSNLSYLHRLPIQGLKIDRYFVKDIESNITKAKMLKGILSLADDLDLEVVVEGIETNQQLQLITQMGSQYGQGFFFSHPLTYSQALNFKPLPTLIK